MVRSVTELNGHPTRDDRPASLDHAAADGGDPLAPNSLIFVERGLETLSDTNLGNIDKLRIIGLLSSYTLSEARMAHDAARAAVQAAATDIDSDPAGFEEDTDFLFGVERILDGVQGLIDGRRRR